MLDAAKACCERWGIDKVTIDDIAAAAGVSRATLYRMFPGGKDVLFDALRVRELEDFFTRLTQPRRRRRRTSRTCSCARVVLATTELRDDEHLALMLASEPGDTLSQLTVDGLPRIIRMAVAVPRAARRAVPRPRRVGAPRRRCSPDSSSRYFLAPSDHVDLGDAASARALHPHPRPPHRSSDAPPGAA